MKREFLKNLNIEGLTDEIINKIMEENGKDVEAVKAKLETANAAVSDWEKKYGENRRSAETNEFLSGYKFVNEYTKKSFADLLNAALEDKANEGKNRKDIFETLTKDKDGKEIMLPK